MKRHLYQSAMEQRFDALKASREAGRQGIQKLLKGYHIDSLTKVQQTGICVLLGLDTVVKGTFVRLVDPPSFEHEIGALTIRFAWHVEVLKTDRLQAMLAPDFEPKPLKNVWTMDVGRSMVWFRVVTADGRVMSMQSPHVYPKQYPHTSIEIKARQLGKSKALEQLTIGMIDRIRSDIDRE
jgi:hypothetical protein